MTDSLRQISRKIALIQGDNLRGGLAGQGVVPTGHAAIDRALGGGMMRGCMHEVLACPEEAGSVAGFVGVLAQRLTGEMMWLREEGAGRLAGNLHPTGLAAIGVDPNRVILAVLPDAQAVLRAAVDCVRCPALGVVVIEVSGDPRALDLTATRRLMLAAEASGVTPVLVRLGGKAAPSAARTRWRVAAAPSVPLPANAPGHPAWDVELLRQRGRPDGGSWRVEWNREHGRLRDWHEGNGSERNWTPLSGAVVSLPFDRPAGAGTVLLRAG